MTKFSLEMGGRTLSQTHKYTVISGNELTEKYEKENLPVRYSITSNRYIDYSYDSLNRLNLKAFNLNNATVYTNYIYKSSERNGENEDTYRTTQLNYEIIDNSSFRYYYDNVGNITQIKTGKRVTDETNSNPSNNAITDEIDYRSYEYDGLNQLTRENDASREKTFTYEYDNMGNILSKTEYGYSSDSLEGVIPVKTIDYTYGNDGKTSWNKLLTSVDLDGDDVLDANESITYDAIGNPTTYLGANLSWFGRQLQSYKKGDLDISYTYDSAGLRGSKTVANGEKISYQYVGDVLYYQHTANADGTTNNEMYFYYDSYGKLSAIRYYVPEESEIKEYTYYVLTNSFGDVLALYGGDGKPRVSYEYDTWGDVLKVYTYSYDTENNTVTKAECTDLNDFAHRNPFRYRSYYYDSETGLYYLQSRYYNPEIGRFLNADSEIASVGGDVQGYNMFSYCHNNPVNASDPTGHWSKWLVGALNVVSGVAQMVAGAALGATVGWTGIGAVAASVLIINGAATATQGVGQIVNHVTKSKVLSEDNIVRTTVEEIGIDFLGPSGGDLATTAYDIAVTASSIYAVGVACKPDFISYLDKKMPGIVNSRVFSHNGGYGYKIGNSIELFYQNPNASGGLGGTILNYNGYFGRYRLDWDIVHGFHSHPPGHQ